MDIPKKSIAPHTMRASTGQGSNKGCRDLSNPVAYKILGVARQGHVNGNKSRLSFVGYIQSGGAISKAACCQFACPMSRLEILGTCTRFGQHRGTR